MSKPKPMIHTNQLIHRLRLMGSAGGMLTRDRIDVVLQAADRLEELDERVAIMLETEGVPSAISLSEVNNHET